jgi:hypothetical protein
MSDNDDSEQYKSPNVVETKQVNTIKLKNNFNAVNIRSPAPVVE